MRALVSTALLAGLLGGCGQSAAPPEALAGDACTAANADSLGGLNLQTATVLEVQRALADHRFTSAELVQHQLDRIARYDARGVALDAIRALAPDALDQARAADARRAARQTRGPFDGVTVLLKDNIGTTDLPTTAGNIALAGNIPKREAFITRRLRDAGAIVLGKTNLSEFANWVGIQQPSGYSSLGGQVVNPYTLGDPSGSSSGSGVGSTMGYATAAIGTETSGSIISPSTANSLVGVKPTLGLVSRTGVIPLAPSWDTPGPMARTVTDAAALLQVLAAADTEDVASARFQAALGGAAPDYLAALSTGALKGARLGVRSLDAGDNAETAWGPAAAVFQQALAVLQAQGAVLVPIDDALDATTLTPATELGGIFNEFKFSLNHYLATEAGPAIPVTTLADIIAYDNQYPEKFPYGQGYLQLSDAQSGLEVDPAYLAAREFTIRHAQAAFDATMLAYDLDAIVGWPGGLTNISITAAAGYPNVVVPMGYDGTTPQGIEFAAQPFEEAKLLGYAYAYEQASRARQPPPVINRSLGSGCR